LFSREAQPNPAKAARHPSHVEYFKSCGYAISDLRTTGGPTKSNVWNQITSDVTGTQITLIDSLSDASLGDAMRAGIGIGVFADFEEAAGKTVRVYRSCYQALSKCFDRIVTEL
jgi:ribulose kinase